MDKGRKNRQQQESERRWEQLTPRPTTQDRPSRESEGGQFDGQLQEFINRRSMRFPESGTNHDVRGNHAGSNYHPDRAGHSIVEIVRARLKDDPYVDDSGIELALQEGQLTISGTVADDGTKKRVKEIVDSIPGIGQVKTQLRARTMDSRGDGEPFSEETFRYD